jgi:hypothetical protein
MGENPQRRTFYASAFGVYLLAFFIWTVPSQRMPIGYFEMFRVSYPLIAVWAILFAFVAYRFRTRCLWLIPSGLPALFWPIHTAIYGLPSCYHTGNCI